MTGKAVSGKRVLECIRQGSVGGGESHMLMLTTELDRSLFDPVVLSFTDGPMIEKMAALGIPHHVISTTKPFDFSVYRRIRTLMETEGIHLVHAHGTRACTNVLTAAKSLGLPIIYTVHGWSFHPGQNWFTSRIRKMAEHYLVSRTDLNICVSASNQLTGQRALGKFNSIVVNNGIDLARFDPKRIYDNLRVGWSIPDEATLIIFLARFTAHKQPMALLDAFNRVKDQVKDLYMVMVGDGDQKNEARDFISRFGLHERVRLEPFREDVPALLSNADIYVLPSLWEGLPIGLLEAMAMGKAVIASDVDGTREIVKNKSNGLLIGTDNLVHNLSNSIICLCRDDQVRQNLSANAIETMRVGFDSTEMTRKIEKVYSSVLNMTKAS